MRGATPSTCMFWNHPGQVIPAQLDRFYFTCSSTQPDIAVYHTLYVLLFSDGLTSYFMLDYSVHIHQTF